MLLRIDVYPPVAEGRDNNNDDDHRIQLPSKTLYASPATVLNRKESSSSNEEGLVARIGRKGENVDILFETDRSISREHALLRFVGKQQQHSSKRTRGRNRKTEEVSPKWCVTPRDQNEAQACEESPYGMCLVLENKGKSGSYVASQDESVVQDRTTNCENEIAVDNDSDATTDDEGPSHPFVSQRGLATSLATQTGEILVSQKNLSQTGKLPGLSKSVQDYFGRETPVRLTKIDPGASHCLSLESDDDSIVIQFGIAQLPTIKITRVPMVVVLSSGILSSIQDSLPLCGGLAMAPGSLPQNEPPEAKTTHLVATERLPVTKQLMAWCYGIPIVSPDFLEAHRNHTNLEDPFPDPLAYLPEITGEKLDFYSKTPRSDLLSNFFVLSADPSPEAEGLAKAAGASLKRLYNIDDANQKPKRHTKAMVTKFVHEAEDLRKEHKGQHFVLLSPSGKATNPNTKSLLQKLTEELGIPTISLKMLAKTIVHQKRWIVGLPASSDRNSHLQEERTTESTSTATNSPTEPPKDASFTANTGTENDDEEDDDSVGSFRMDFVASEAKDPNKSLVVPTPQPQSPTTSFHSNEEDPGRLVESEQLMDSEGNSAKGSAKRRDQEHESAEENGSLDSTERSQGANNTRVMPTSEDSIVTKRKALESKQVRLGKADANGWLQPAPKDDKERSKWRKKASEAYERKHGLGLEPSASTHQVVFDVIISGTGKSSSHRRPYQPPSQPLGGPNYKRFRKNSIPRRPKDEPLIILTKASITSSRLDEEALSQEELEVQREQRLADALFHGEDIPRSRRRR